MLKLDAKPGPIEVELTKCAVVVVDMQNAFASKGGMLDLAGVDISNAPRVVSSIKTVVNAARQASVPIVHVQMGYKPDLSNSGGPNSPNWHKELAIHLMRCRPELQGTLLTEGTWDFAIVEELSSERGDQVVIKTKYSGFAGTTLYSQLRTRCIRYLFFVGIATNVCVESTLRDAYFQDYWPILIADGAMPAGPATLHEATIFNVEIFFGWTIRAEEFVRAIRTTKP